MSHPYRAGTPAFPTLPTVIYRLEELTPTVTVMAVLDSGADGTLVPLRLLTSMHADWIRRTRIHSHWGETRTAVVYMIDLEVAGERLPAVEVVADEQGDDVLLGRNVLNRLILLLDGPGRKTDVLTRRPPRL